MTARRLLLVLLLVLAGISAPPAGSQPLPASSSDAGIEIAGAFVVGAPITGATRLHGFLYVTTADRLVIYDVADPADPVVVGSAPSPRTIYGELLSTDGRILLLNNGLVSGTLDVWNVEDKTNPVLVANVPGIVDEHVSCLLRCSWAYGSNGTIIQLISDQPVVRSENWLEMIGGRERVHRIDEFRHGYMASAPRGKPPQIVDVRRPLNPRVIATARVPEHPPSHFLYTSWLRRGKDRFVISSGELARCDEEWRGALTTFDTGEWPEKEGLPLLDTYRYRGRSDSEEDGCSSYYFSLRPGFRNGGILVLPNGLEGLRLIHVDRDGELREVDSFTPPISDVWLTFWIDREIFYALNSTGEVYILRYDPAG